MKASELKPGMLTTEGLIIRVGKAGDSKFWGDTDYIKAFDLNDAYYGPFSWAIGMDAEFKILHDRGTKEYRKVVRGLVKERVSYLSDVESDIDLLIAYAEILEDEQ